MGYTFQTNVREGDADCLYRQPVVLQPGESGVGSGRETIASSRPGQHCPINVEQAITKLRQMDTADQCAFSVQDKKLTSARKASVRLLDKGQLDLDASPGETDRQEAGKKIQEGVSSSRTGVDPCPVIVGFCTAPAVLSRLSSDRNRVKHQASESSPDCIDISEVILVGSPISLSSSPGSPVWQLVNDKCPADRDISKVQPEIAVQVKPASPLTKALANGPASTIVEFDGNEREPSSSPSMWEGSLWRRPCSPPHSDRYQDDLPGNGINIASTGKIWNKAEGDGLKDRLQASFENLKLNVPGNQMRADPELSSCTEAESNMSECRGLSWQRLDQGTMHDSVTGFSTPATCNSSPMAIPHRERDFHIRTTPGIQRTSQEGFAAGRPAKEHETQEKSEGRLVKRNADQNTKVVIPSIDLRSSSAHAPLPKRPSSRENQTRSVGGLHATLQESASSITSWSGNEAQMAVSARQLSPSISLSPLGPRSPSRAAAVQQPSIAHSVGSPGFGKLLFACHSPSESSLSKGGISQSLVSSQGRNEQQPVKAVLDGYQMGEDGQSTEGYPAPCSSSGRALLEPSLPAQSILSTSAPVLQSQVQFRSQQPVRQIARPVQRRLVGSFEECSLAASQLSKRKQSYDGFQAMLLVAAGRRSSRQRKYPFSVTHLDGSTSSLYSASIPLGGSSAEAPELHSQSRLRVPHKGRLQLVICNPELRHVHTYLCAYDFSDMPPNTKTFLRQKAYVLKQDSGHLPSSPSYNEGLVFDKAECSVPGLSKQSLHVAENIPAKERNGSSSLLPSSFPSCFSPSDAALSSQDLGSYNYCSANNTSRGGHEGGGTMQWRGRRNAVSLRYLLHLRFLCLPSKTSHAASSSLGSAERQDDGNEHRLYLYGDIRVVFPMRHLDQYEGQVVVVENDAPSNPKYFDCP